MPRSRWRALLACSSTAALAAASLFVGVSPASAAGADVAAKPVIETVSNPRPQLVSGGQVLVRVTPPAGVAAGRLQVSVNGRDITRRFEVQADGTLLGLVTGLRRKGDNEVLARVPGGPRRALSVVNHPITGPVFSGPQQQPFYCETTSFGLPETTQPRCSLESAQVSYQYRTTAGAFAPYDGSVPPAAVASATSGSRTVPYIVRVERGTIDRAVYEVAALYDGRPPSPLRPDTSWNGKLVYTFGGGCNAGYHQGRSTGGVLNDLFLRQGYAVASSTLNVLNNNCSPVISAEAAMMVKEHVIETYGPVQHTIGWGGSGGAIQQYTIADAYPGILDGIVPGISFPDPITTSGPVSDCRLLDRYYGLAPTATVFTPQQQAVSGFRSYSTCGSWDATFASRSTATESCDVAIPVAVRYDPVTNPGGVKCGSLEQVVTQLGRDPRTGFVRSTLDNVGVQYGLDALQAGTITAAEFVDLNARVGGFDVAGNPVAQRTVADPAALEAAYATDLINSASQGLRTTPIIDQRTDLDLRGHFADIHTTEWSYVMRARLQRANGTAGNQVILETSADPATATAAAAYELDAMDWWLSALAADTSGADRQAKVLAARPADLGDGCYTSATQRVREELTYPGSGTCGALFPVGGNTRLAAGSPLDMLPLKCRLRPLALSDYPVSFTARQQVSLRDSFPDGVCDYSREGVGQRSPIAPWLSYGDGRHTGTEPVPVPLPRAAGSV